MRDVLCTQGTDCFETRMSSFYRQVSSHFRSDDSRFCCKQENYNSCVRSFSWVDGNGNGDGGGDDGEADDHSGLHVDIFLNWQESTKPFPDDLRKREKTSFDIRFLIFYAKNEKTWILIWKIVVATKLDKQRQNSDLLTHLYITLGLVIFLLKKRSASVDSCRTPKPYSFNPV